MMQENKLRWWLYILKLENDKWYVGITSKQPEERFQEHKLGKRAAYWTMKYKPLEIELIEDLGSISKQHAEEYENKVTRQLMMERGLNNVRGGDLRDTDMYTGRFGRIWKKQDYDDMKMAFIAAVTLFLLSFYILWQQITAHNYCAFFCK